MLISVQVLITLQLYLLLPDPHPPIFDPPTNRSPSKPSAPNPEPNPKSKIQNKKNQKSKIKIMLQSSHGTPPIPSPARLGLSNPSIPSISSPSLPPNPNPNPNKPPSSSSSSSSASQPQSTALLSLLPPLPRAQSLLNQMASLSSRLFELSPNRALWSSSYRSNLPSFLSSSPPPPPSSASSTRELLSQLHSLQTLLFQSVAELQEILDLQDSTKNLAREIKSADAALLSFANKLKDSELVLDRLVDDYSDYLANSNSNLDLNEVLAYAHKISYTTFAPPEHASGLAPLRGALPPAPQDNEMRASQLYQFADLDVGVPKTAPLAGEGKVGAAAETAVDVLMEPTPPREEVPAMPGIPPPMLPISLPPGWKKGMPVELPMELPPVPPGWKPGDPVPLPPLDGVVVGNKEEVPRVPAPVQKAPEAIQVKYVQLDINPDQDEYSSEYSSDVGSSEEDDDD